MNTWQEGRAIFCGGGSPGLPFLSRVALYGQDKEAAVATYRVGGGGKEDLGAPEKGVGTEKGDEKVGVGRVRKVLSCGLQAAWGPGSAEDTPLLHISDCHIKSSTEETQRSCCRHSCAGGQREGRCLRDLPSRQKCSCSLSFTPSTRFPQPLEHETTRAPGDPSKPAAQLCSC